MGIIFCTVVSRGGYCWVWTRVLSMLPLGEGCLQGRGLLLRVGRCPPPPGPEGGSDPPLTCLYIEPWV